MNTSGSLQDNLEFLTQGRGHQLLEAGGGTETQRIANEFGMLFIGPQENAVSIDEPKQRNKCFFTALLDIRSARNPPYLLSTYISLGVLNEGEGL